MSLPQTENSSKMQFPGAGILSITIIVMVTQLNERLFGLVTYRKLF